MTIKAGRPIGTKNAVKKVVKPLKKKCFSCGEDILLTDYYASNNSKHTDHKMNICKVCSKPEDINNLNQVRIKLSQLGRPLIMSVWNESVKEAINPEGIFGKYIKNIQLKGSKYQFADEMFIDDSIAEINNEEIQDVVTEEIKTDELYIENRNKDDVIRMLGYDPFAKENESDKLHLHNKLVDFLDESTLEDSFKLPTVIEIVKTFNQIDKINNSLSNFMADDKMMGQNIKGITDLLSAKDKMYKSVLALAKDNGISVNHNNNKSKGGNTLNGIIKKLNEIGLQEAEINLFDLETCDAMKQIANFSNKSIMETLMLDENDYSGMVLEQRELIQKLDSKVITLEEENRLLKIKIKNIT